MRRKALYSTLRPGQSEAQDGHFLRAEVAREVEEIVVLASVTWVNHAEGWKGASDCHRGIEQYLLIARIMLTKVFSVIKVKLTVIFIENYWFA
ncbi:hypothetical protein E2C01_077824 [Portunus trituberculatus]|uniref:Uncharacterized protein n=1 Tax=Portunus trituberculatus TaxID=210409 RepID=A0A5B7ICF6_PORTR|nr:hypothetical protein [Portunus trituberculatus]